MDLNIIECVYELEHDRIDTEIRYICLLIAMYHHKYILCQYRLEENVRMHKMNDFIIKLSYGLNKSDWTLSKIHYVTIRLNKYLI